MYIAVCDDEKNCHDIVEHMLQKFMEKKQIEYHIEHFFDGESLVSAYENNRQFDLIFLDIYMGALDGIATAREIRKRKGVASVIFLTTSRDFAVESYQVSALSYLLKTTQKEEFYEVMNRFLEQYRPAKVQIEECIFTVSDLVYAESFNKKIVLHFSNHSTEVVSGKFEELIDSLDFPNFLHCHRCYLVNLDQVRKIGEGFFLTVTNEQVLIRQKEFYAIKKRYYQYVLSR